MKPNDQGRAATGGTEDGSKTVGSASEEAGKGAFAPGAMPGPSNLSQTGVNLSIAPRDEERAFDHWLTRKLGRIYDGLRSRPVPDNLLRIIEGHRKKKS